MSRFEKAAFFAMLVLLLTLCILFAVYGFWLSAVAMAVSVLVVVVLLISEVRTKDTGTGWKKPGG